MTAVMLRSIVGVVTGLLLITLLVESLEFALVAIVNGGLTTDPGEYFSIRNRLGFLMAKIVYNTAAAVAGGFVAAWIARRAPVAHGIVLAIVQTAAFGWALVNPAIRRTTPDWMWGALIVATFLGIVAGSRIAQARRPAR